MDKNKQPTTKLAGLRTFAKDQESKNPKTTATETPDVMPIKEPKISDHDFKIHHPKKEVVNIKENIVVKEVTKPTPIAVPLPPLPPPPKPATKKTDNKINILDENEDAGSATIITDTKKDRFKLFPAISLSIKNWVDKIKIDRQAKKAPKYTVPETTRRKGVIQKATSLTGKVTSSDHDTLQERIKQRQNSKQDEGVDDSVTWTPNTEPGYLLLEDSTSQISNVQVQQRKSFFTTQQDIVVKNLDSLKANNETVSSKDESDTRWETPNINTDVDVTVPTPKPFQKIIETKPETPIQEPVKIEPKVEIPQTITPEQEQPVLKAVEVSVPSLPPVEHTISQEDEIIKEKPERQNNGNGFLFSKNTNTLSFYIFVIILGVFIFIGIGYFLSKNKEVEEVPTAIDYPKVINADINLVFQPITNKYDFVTKITSEFRETQSDAFQFVFITAPDSLTAIKPSALLTHIGIKLNADFNQSVTNLYFGQIHHTSPFISFTVMDTETAKGGMLAWEQNMRNEIYPILKLEALKEGSSTNIKFIDAMIGGVDVRVLKGINGEEEIIYGFTDSHTIIITNNSNSFGELLQLTK